MVCDLVDSVNKLTVSAYTLTENGNKEPLRDEVVSFYIPRMFSMLKIIARLEDHSDFGNVEKYEIRNRGKKADKLSFIHRALWTAVAPIWMIITLTIMLTGVWAYYL